MRQNKQEKKSPYTMFNTVLLRCSAELVHSTGMAHMITHMQAGILSSIGIRIFFPFLIFSV